MNKKESIWAQMKKKSSRRGRKPAAGKHIIICHNEKNEYDKTTDETGG